MARIRFETSGKEVEFEEGVETNILRSSIRHEAQVPYKCGGGLCGTCKVHVEEGYENLTGIKKLEVARLGELLDQGYRLACQTFAKGNCTLTWEPSQNLKVNEKLKQFWESGI